MANYSNNLGQIRLGWRTAVSTTPVNTNDVDATAFITAAGITDSTQISALNTLVNDLKTYGLWTKMKALYPFVGGSATSHKWNLKDPRDLDAAFRLQFNGGWTHNSNGVTPNGTNGYADTYLTPNTSLSLLNQHISFYSRTNSTGGVDIAAGESAATIQIWGSTLYYDVSSGGYKTVSVSNSTGLIMAQRLNYVNNVFKDNSKIKTDNLGSYEGFLPSTTIELSRVRTGGYYSNKNLAFASIGDGLTDTEAANFYNSVQKFQTTLGRQIGSPIVSDTDAQAFINAAGLTDLGQANAVNTLVVDLKSAGVWTKMKALYPFVGGNATSHKFNLKDPRDLDAAYRLVFNGGWTHTSTGALPNGTTGWADTKLSPSTTLTQWNTHISYYSRTSTRQSSSIDMGSADGIAVNLFCLTLPRTTGGGGSCQYSQTNASEMASFSGLTDASGFWLSSRTSNIGNTHKASRNGIILATASTSAGNLVSQTIKIACLEANYLSNKETCFNSIGDGLTDAESTNLYTAVQAFQTTLGRQVNVPLVSDTDAQSFLNAANITSFQQASAVNKLVVDLKAAGVWSKMKAIYPFVGGSAASHKFNLKDPRDLDAAYRLVFNGGWAHSSTGALPNGTTGYADTKLNAANTLTNFNTSLSTYLRTTSVGLYFDMGLYEPGTEKIMSIYANYLNPTSGSSGAEADTGSWNTSRIRVTNSDSKGFYTIKRTSNNNLKLFKNGSLLGSNTAVDNNTLVSKNILISAVEFSNTYQQFSNRETAFASIGDGLTDTEATSLYNAVQTYQTALGRAVDTPVYNNGLVLNLDAGNANSYPGTGTTWFDLAAGNNGTLVNGPTYDATNGGSLLFDGVNDYVNLGTSFTNLTTQLSISFWGKINGNPSDGIIITKGEHDGTSTSNFGFQIYPSFSLSFYAKSGGTYTVATSDANILDNNINYYTLTYNNGVVIFYKNGVLYSSHTLSLSSLPASSAPLYIGALKGYNRYYPGVIHNLSMYNRALSATEILNNFNSTRGRFGL